MLGRRLVVVAANGRREAFQREGLQREAFQIVGLVPALHLGGAASADPRAPGFFTPLAQQARRRALFPVVTGGGRRPALQAALLGAIRAVDPERPPRRTWTFREDLDRAQSGLPIFVRLFGAFGLAALALSALGLYGLIAVTVRQRTREIGTRVALGATRTRILTLFLTRSARHLALGLAAGAALGTLLLTLTEQRLGPLAGALPAFALVATTLLLIGVLATAIPAWRATHLPPTVALRR